MKFTVIGQQVEDGELFFLHATAATAKDAMVWLETEVADSKAVMAVTGHLLEGEVIFKGEELPEKLETVAEVSASGEKYAAIGISTTNLTVNDVELLTFMAKDPSCNMVSMRHTGFFVKLYNEPGSNHYPGASSTLRSLMSDVLAGGCRLIEFDTDAEPFGDYPLFEH